jgi:dienelactone hydrolase
MNVPATTLNTLIRVLAVAVCVRTATVAPDAVAEQAAGPAQPVLSAPGTAAPVPGRGRGPQPVDPRVQIRMHHFAETNQDIPYSLFVSSKVTKKKKAPLIVTLHGIGGTHTTMMRANAIDLAEAGGYILLAPMGYNPRGWYGAPPPQGRRGARPAPHVDAGPAAFAVDREGLSRIPKMPIMLVHGDMDTVVPVTVGRAWAEAMTSIPMKDAQYIEVPGGDHGTVIGSHQAELFAFFARHSK